jgi:hypothetical protein
VKKLVCLLLLMAAAACSGDSTGSRPSLAGQWLYRVRLDAARGDPSMKCTVSGAVSFQETGGQVSGRMLHPLVLCVSPAGTGVDHSALDSTTTVSGTADGDSLLLTLQGPGLTVTQSVRLLGDSLTGRVLDGGGGTVGGRLFADSVKLGRATIQLSGGRSQTVPAYARMSRTRVILEGTNGQSPGLVLTPFDYGPNLSTGTFTVGGVGSVYHGFYAGPIVGGHYDPYVAFSSGQVTVTYADAQIARGTIDASGPTSDTGVNVRAQAEFVAIVDRLPNQF